MNYVIHCYGHDGSILGYRDEDDTGKPLTKREAEKIARRENELSALHRLYGQPGCFDYRVAQAGKAGAK